MVASVGYNAEGFHPGMTEGMEQITAEMLMGSPWHEEYLQIAPDPDHFAEFFEKMKEMNVNHVLPLTLYNSKGMPRRHPLAVIT